MKQLGIIAACVALCFLSCSKIDGLKSDEKGFVSVDGERKISLDYGYEADYSGIAMGKSVWHLFERQQQPGSVDLEQYVVYLRAGANPVTGKSYPYTVFVKSVPGCEDFYLDGIQYEEGKGYFYKELAHFVQAGEEPEWNLIPVTVHRFSFPDSCGRLQADITVEKNGRKVRIVFNGPTPNDGIVYMMD